MQLLKDGKVIDARGRPIDGYDLTEEINRAVSTKRKSKGKEEAVLNNWQGDGVKMHLDIFSALTHSPITPAALSNKKAE